jgi:glycosyltransferase involved in cell wall biosynthesis
MRYRLLVVGRLVERKGVADVIEALRWLPDSELVIAGGPAADRLGDDPDVTRLRAAAARSGVSDRVRFLGRVSRTDLPALMRSADAVVSVPTYEPFGIVPLEAMACGVPVVVSAVGGLPESVVDRQTGLHVPPGDPRRLPDSLALLLGDSRMRRRLATAGVHRVHDRYGWPRVAISTRNVYTQTVRSARSRATEAVR